MRMGVRSWIRRTELLGRIMRQEGRHAGYYSSAARDLLQERRAQKVTKWFLVHRSDAG